MQIKGPDESNHPGLFNHIISMRQSVLHQLKVTALFPNQVVVMGVNPQADGLPMYPQAVPAGLGVNAPLHPGILGSQGAYFTPYQV